MSCVSTDFSSGIKSSTRVNACGVDLSLEVNLERASFIPPEVWSRIKPCELVKVSHHPILDSWGISAALNYTYSDVLVYDFAMGFGVEGHLNWIGNTPDTLEGWKAREDNKWQKRLKKRGDLDKRIVTYDSRHGLDCWRTERIAYDRGTLHAKSIFYDCWYPDALHYPPLSIGGSIRYIDGKPAYALNIDKDLIDPVFATLKVKDIKPEVYAERMAIHEKKVKEDCKWRLKDVKRNPTREFNAYSIKKLEFCGYDTSKLKREEE